MNEELKKEAYKIIENHCRYCDRQKEIEMKCWTDIQIDKDEIDKLIDRATLAERKRCAEVVRKGKVHSEKLHEECINGTAEICDRCLFIMGSDKMIEDIATAIEKGEKV